MTKYAVVGAGITGAVIANILSNNAANKVDVFERRDIVGGNVADEYTQKYGYRQLHGPHFFHTENKKVIRYLSKYTTWIPYRHRVMSSLGGGIYVPVPANLDTIRILYPETYIQTAKELLDRFGFGSSVQFFDIINDSELSDQSKNVINIIRQQLFVSYSQKQWGVYYQDMESAMSKRFRLRLSMDDSYFQARYQVMPTDGQEISFSTLIQRLLEEHKVHVITSSEIDKKDISKYDKVFYTGAIDEFFDYTEGDLPYITRHWLGTHTKEEGKHYLPPVVNFPDNDYIRRIKYYDIGIQKNNISEKVTYFEKSKIFDKTKDIDRYYPVETKRGAEIYNAYIKKNAGSNIVFCGRLGSFKYYDMDTAVAEAIRIAQRG